MLDLRPESTPYADAFGVDITVTRPAPNNAPVAIAKGGIWLAPIESDQPYGTSYKRLDPLRRMAIARTALDALPTGSLIAAPELAGGAVKTFKVVEYERPQDSEWWRVVLSL